MCTRCYSTDLEWVEAEGGGRLVAFTCIAIAPPFMMAQGYDRKHPYLSGVVELDGGGGWTPASRGSIPTGRSQSGSAYG